MSKRLAVNHNYIAIASGAQDKVIDKYLEASLSNTLVINQDSTTNTSYTRNKLLDGRYSRPLGEKRNIKTNSIKTPNVFTYPVTPTSTINSSTTLLNLSSNSSTTLSILSLNIIESLSSTKDLSNGFAF